MERRQHSIVKSGVATLDTKKCHLCASEALHVYSKPSSWPEETREWVEKLCSQCSPTDAVVCRACEKYIKRHVGKANVTPRWLPKSKAHNIYCVVEGCGELSHTATSIVTYKVAQEYLDIPGDCCTTSQSLSLCKSHYQYLYREVHYPQPCEACSSQPRYGGDYICQCPDPARITLFLQEMFEFSGALSILAKYVSHAIRSIDRSSSKELVRYIF